MHKYIFHNKKESNRHKSKKVYLRASFLTAAYLLSSSPLIAALTAFSASPASKADGRGDEPRYTVDMTEVSIESAADRIDQDCPR
eukprot:1363627-Amorphochlora_amoeboformis.AAC.1